MHTEDSWSHTTSTILINYRVKFIFLLLLKKGSYAYPTWYTYWQEYTSNQAYKRGDHYEDGKKLGTVEAKFTSRKPPKPIYILKYTSLYLHPIYLSLWHRLIIMTICPSKNFPSFRVSRDKNAISEWRDIIWMLLITSLNIWYIIIIIYFIPFTQDLFFQRRAGSDFSLKWKLK